MKKMVLALVAMMTMTAAMAQGDNQKGEANRRKMNKTEMIKNRTNETVKKYGLNEQQAAKLLELNTKFADVMGPGMRGPGGRGPRGNGGARPRPDDNTTAQQPQTDGKQKGNRPEMTEEMREQMKAQRQKRQEAMKKYDTELQAIMTADQFKAYKADQEKRMKEGGRRGGRRN